MTIIEEFDCTWIIEKYVNASDLCLVNTANIHSIMRDEKYFLNITSCKTWINTISGRADITEGYEKPIIWVENGIKMWIQNVLYANSMKRNLIFKDIRNNWCHIENVNKKIFNVFILHPRFWTESYSEKTLYFVIYFILYKYTLYWNLQNYEFGRIRSKEL